MYLLIGGSPIYLFIDIFKKDASAFRSSICQVRFNSQWVLKSTRQGYEFVSRWTACMVGGELDFGKNDKLTNIESQKNSVPNRKQSSSQTSKVLLPW
ncbi:MAG: hypothetical protein DRR19_09550 [Candidatus Parabeggiatoa sp. nov. 1]|nr:MAG: hypothetical protein DRR19_09550 [Gammaproteobacteria bacterium]